MKNIFLPPGQSDYQGHKRKPTCLPDFSGHAKLRGAAIFWFNFGFSVIPLIAGTKQPAVKWDPWLNGLSHARIKRHWLKFPDHEIGFIVGNGNVIFDADSAAAVTALEQTEEQHGVQPLLVVKTRRGEHHYFAKDPDWCGRTGFKIVGGAEDRIDIKTGRTMVILPPSKDKVLFKLGGDRLENASGLSVAPLPFIEAFLPKFVRPELLPTPCVALVAQPGSSHTLNLIRASLGFLDPDMTRPAWFSAGAAIFNTTQGDPRGYKLFDEWSSGGAKYKGTRETSDIWNYFNSSHARKANMGKLIKLVQEAGHSWAEVQAAAESLDALDGEDA